MATSVKGKNTKQNLKTSGKTKTSKPNSSSGKGSKTVSKGVMKVLQKVAKIDKLPKDVKDSIPLRGFMRNGIIETYEGTFTKSYKIHDVNFDIAPTEEQTAIFKNFMSLLNSFNDNTKWQFCIFNHEIDKKQTIEEIRIAPQRDGLNKYRQEMNGILLNNLKNGNNSIKQDKYLTVSVEDFNAEHAATVLSKLDIELNKKLKRISKVNNEPMTTQERMKVLYDIYNQDNDYRMTTSIYDGEEKFDIGFLEKCGLSVKDVIGPSSFEFKSGTNFKMGDMYGQALYIERVPTYLSTSIVSDLSDIQSNMLISITSETVNQEVARKLVKNQLASIEAEVVSITKRNGDNGFYGSLPPDLERAQENARELKRDMDSRNQKIFFLTITVVVFARTLEHLEENIKLVKSVGEKHICPIKPLNYQQEFGLNTALPLCRNDLNTSIMFTTESAAVFIPYNSQEINQKNAIFYGLNQTTKSMVLCDRTTGSNYNGLIFGYSGSGKSFTAKCEMLSVLLNHPDAQVFVIDPQGEYYPLTRQLNGQEIVLSPGSNVFINPLDLDITEDKEDESDPITMKSDFILSIFDIIIGKGRSLAPIHTSLIDKCVKKIYKPYVEELLRRGETFDASICPTLSDLYQELKMLGSERAEATQLADILYQYAVGSFNTFAHRTNVETSARFVVYNTKSLGTGMKELGLHICTNDIWNRMIANSKKQMYTWFYIDEFHVLLESEGTTLFLKRIWKMARKWNGVPTGIMQNTEDLLRDSNTRAIINNTSFVIMLKEPLMDRQNLAELFHLSNAQLEYITDSEPGHGLLFNGKITIPFGYKFPKNTDLYKMLTTSHDVEGALFV